MSGVDEKVKGLVRECESGIVKHEMKFNYYTMPLLTDPLFKRRLASVIGHLSLHIEVTLNFFTVPLEELDDSYMSCDQSVKNQWYWYDDNTFLPYSSIENQRIEELFFKRHTTIEMNIGKFSYTINTDLMIQTNQLTKKERPIRRISIPSKSPKITVSVQAYKDCIDEICNKFKEILEIFVTESNITLPSEAMPFKHILSKTSQKNFVESDLIEKKDSDFAVISL